MAKMLKLTRSMSIPTTMIRSRLRRLLAYTTGRTADPEVHSCPAEGKDVAAAAAAALASMASKPPPPLPDSDPFNPIIIKPPQPPLSTHKLEHNPITPPPHPTKQQRRTSTNTAVFKCGTAGVDVGKGWGWSEEEREFFRKHKTSALENVKVVDTRKPITRVMHGTADSREEGGLGLAAVWEETAEETMARAAEMWRRRREMGDPDSPHGKVLRQLRGEL